MNVITILKEALIGKEIRVCVYCEIITQPKTTSHAIHKRTVILGTHKKYETHTIMDIVPGFDEHSDYPAAVLSNGQIAQLRYDDYIPHAYNKPE